MSNVVDGHVAQGSAIAVMGRFRNLAGELPIPSQVSNIDGYTVNEKTGVQSDTFNPSVPESIFETLQDDQAWKESGGDSTGYNIRVVVPATALPDANVTYRVIIKVTLSDGDVRWLRGRVSTWSTG